MKSKISLIIHTASTDDFLTGQGLPSYFQALNQNLIDQTLNGFELVYVDTWYDENKTRFEDMVADLPYEVKHVPLHPAHRYWFDKGCCYISAAKNTGILYADGELCISCDDAEFFPDRFLETAWGHYQAGRLMHALHKRLKNIKTLSPVEGDVYVNDHRWGRVAAGPHVHPHGSWLFAGTSFPLELALDLNGYNERMDGCKSLEDCEFGTRMALTGKRFVMDPSAGFLYILDHPSYAESMDIGWEKQGGDTFDGQAQPMLVRQRRAIENFIAVENYGMICCANELMDLVANRGTLSHRHMRIIQRETIKYRNFDPLADANAANLEIWRGTPTFDLRQQRAELRASPDWRW